MDNIGCVAIGTTQALTESMVCRVHTWIIILMSMNGLAKCVLKKIIRDIRIITIRNIPADPKYNNYKDYNNKKSSNGSEI